MVRLRVPGGPRGVAFTPDGARAFVTCENGHSVAVVDMKRRRLAGSVELDEAEKPAGVALSADGSRLFVTTGRGSLRAFDRSTLGPRGSLGVDGRPWGIASTPDGRKIYTANGLANAVAVVDASTFGLVKTIGLGEGPWGVAVSP